MKYSEKIPLTDELREELRETVDQIVIHQTTTRADIAEALGLPHTRLRDILVNERVRYIPLDTRNAIDDLHAGVYAGRIRLAVSHQGREAQGQEYLLITDGIRRMIREIHTIIGRRGLRKTDIPELADVSRIRYINLINTAQFPGDRSASRKVLKKIRASEFEAFRTLARKWRISIR